MKLDPDEKKLLESFERGEWTSVEGARIAVRECARQQLRVDVKAGFDAIARDTGRSHSPVSGRQPTSCNHHIQCKLDEEMMLDLANDIRSLSDFKRNTLHLLDRIRKTGNPMVLTVNGKAELVVQDAEAYQALLDRIEAIEGIQRGLADVKAGRTKPAPQVFARLRRKHGVSR